MLKLLVLAMMVSGLLYACQENPAPNSALTGSANPNQAKWKRHPGNPVIPIGFDAKPGVMAIAAADPSVMYDAEEKKWKMWFGCGYEEAGTIKLGVKYAESPDGMTWTPQEGLAYEPQADGEAWDGTHTETPTVVKNPAGPPERRYMLWVAGGNKRKGTLPGGYPFYKMGHAYSADGKRFTRLPAGESPYQTAGMVLDAKDLFPGNSRVKSGIVSDPKVVLKDGRYYLWAPGIGLDEASGIAALGIVHATSTDGVRWTPSAKNPLPSLNLPGGNGAAYPSVFWNADKGHFDMWYSDETNDELKPIPVKDNTTAGYWHATSMNGEDWSVDFRAGRDFIMDPGSPGEAKGLMAGVEVARKDGTLYMFYGAHGTQKLPPLWPAGHADAINMATRPE